MNDVQVNVAWLEGITTSAWTESKNQQIQDPETLQSAHII